MAGTGTMDRGHVADERPELSAETMSPAVRYGLLALTLVAAALTLVTMIAVFVSPAGVYDLGTWGVALIGTLVVLIWVLLIVFGALLENNRRLESARHRGWVVAFALTGPFGLLFYWFMHVWRAPYEPDRG